MGDTPMHETATTATVAAELVSAQEAARICGVSKATWWSHHSAGLIPQPVRIGGRTLWRRAELNDWIRAGCPPRSKWTWPQ